MAVTVKDIARLTGVSIGTIDRVLHRRGRVAPETEERVRSVIEKTGFVPNPHASNLAAAKRFRIGILIPKMDQDSGFWKIPVAGMTHAVRDLSLFNVQLVMSCFNRSSAASFNKAGKALLDDRPDGILMAPVIPDAAKAFMKAVNDEIPFCLFDSDLPDTRRISFIGQDSYMSGRLAGKLMSMLVPAGRNTVIIQPVETDYHIRGRIEGFRACFLESSQPKVFVEKRLGDPVVCGGFVDALLKETPDLGGIFVANALVHRVAACLKKIRSAEIRLIGYDLIRENRRYTEEGVIDFLISQRPEVQGYLGVRTLFRALSGQEKPPETQIIPLDILTRENIGYYAPDMIYPMEGKQYTRQGEKQ